MRLPILIALAGAVLSALLWSGHMADGGALAGICRAGSACDTVLGSPWATIPPARSGPGSGGLPVAALGLVWFGGLALWLLVIGRAGETRRGLHATLLTLVSAGCIVSLALLVLMLRGVGALCPLCLGAHLCQFALLGTVYACRPRADVPVEGIDPDHPRPRLVYTALALIVVFGVAALSLGQAASLRAERDVLRAERDELMQRGGLLELEYLDDTRFTSSDAAAARFDAVLRDDDPMIEPAPGAYMTLVWFSDVQCSNCLEFDRFLSEVVRPLFNGHLKVVYKHFPMTNMHEHAEGAARALEAARRQGMFWELHHALLDRRDELGDLDWRGLAAETVLDATRFEVDRLSGPASARVTDDVRRALAIGVDSTPTIFLDRRAVSRTTRVRRAFWQLRADALRRAREKIGQPW